MSVLQQLKQDHGNMRRLLDILDHQVDLVDSAENSDFELMRDIMHYMTVYPDGFHHPLEDLVVEALIERDPSSRPIVLSLVREHTDLAKKSTAFFQMLQKVSDGELVLRKDIVTRGRDYIEFLRSHMGREEERFFPRAESMLTEGDWQKVADGVAHRADPVFGHVVEAQYRAIYEFIFLQSDGRLTSVRRAR